MELTEKLCLIPLLFVQVHRLFEATVRRRLQTDRALSDLCLCSLANVMLYLPICIVMKLVVLVSLDWLCINDVIYDLRLLEQRVFLKTTS